MSRTEIIDNLLLTCEGLFDDEDSEQGGDKEFGGVTVRGKRSPALKRAAKHGYYGKRKPKAGKSVIQRHGRAGVSWKDAMRGERPAEA